MEIHFVVLQRRRPGLGEKIKLKCRRGNRYFFFMTYLYGIFFITNSEDIKNIMSKYIKNIVSEGRIRKIFVNDFVQHS